MSEQRIQNPLKSKVAMGFMSWIFKYPERAYMKGITEEFDYAPSTVTEVFKALRRSDLVKVRKEGRKKFYEPNKKEIAKNIAIYGVPHNPTPFEMEEERDFPSKIPKFDEIHLYPGQKKLFENQRARTLLFGLFIKEVIENTEFEEKIRCKMNFVDIAEKVLERVRSEFRVFFIAYYGEPDVGHKSAPKDLEKIYNFFSGFAWGLDSHGYFEAVKHMFGESDETKRLIENPEELKELEKEYDEKSMKEEAVSKEELKELNDKILKKQEENRVEEKNFYKKDRVRVTINDPEKGDTSLIFPFTNDMDDKKDD